jgi:hypothetical protein
MFDRWRKQGRWEGGCLRRKEGLKVNRRKSPITGYHRKESRELF